MKIAPATVTAENAASEAEEIVEPTSLSAEYIIGVP